MTYPLITVVMSTYNIEKYVAEAVDSILSQTFTDFEFVIVEDGSQDSTLRILESYQDERIRIIRTENRGLANALNTGLDAATGKYIARMDSDDVSSQRRLEVLLSEAEKSRDLALVGSWYEVIDEEGNFLTKARAPLSNSELWHVMLSGHNPFCHGGVLFRRDVVEKLCGYRPEFKNSQDFDLWLRLGEQHPMSMVPEVLYSWRLRRGSVGSGARMRQRAYGKAARQCLDQRQKGLPEQLPNFGQKRSFTSRGLLSRLDKQSAYAAVKTNFLLQSGHRREASQLALKSVALSPWNVVAWAATLRALKSWV